MPQRKQRDKAMDENAWLGLTALLMAAVLVVPAGLQGAKGRVLLYAAVWLAVVVALMWGYDLMQPGG
jgi:hypothetical protein